MPYKTEDGKRFPAEAYAYVPDPEAPSTWKLRLWATPGGGPDAAIVGAAIAALGKGFRGRKVQIPAADLPAVKKKVRAAWKKANPDKDEEQMPAVIRESAARDGDGTCDLREYASSRGLSLRVDREAGRIRGVKVLGRTSRNGREYTAESLSKAAGLYEGIRVNVDHRRPSDQRSYRDRLGRLENVRVREDGLYADLVYNPKHALAEQLAWDAEYSPENVGLSHDARGRTVRRNGTLVVEEIEAVRSVDLVADPATTRGLFEADAAAAAATADADAGDGGDDDDDAPVDVGRLPDRDFALVLPGGVKVKDRTFPLSKRLFPLATKGQVRTALRAIPNYKRINEPHRQEALRRAKQAAERLGVSITTEQKESEMDLSKLTLDELQASRPDLVDSLQEDLKQGDEAKAREAELKSLKEEVTKLKEEKASHEREAAIQKELAEAKLDPANKTAVSDLFLESLRAEPDAEKRKKLIEDRAALVKAAGPAGNGRTEPKSGSRYLAESDEHTPGATLEERVAGWRR